jgi:hypothetical protein
MSQGFTSALNLPLPVASGGTGVTTSTGTGSTVLNVSPTLTTPTINQINDTNGNANLAIYAATNAVNYMTSVNSPTGGFTGFEVTGADTNATAYMKPKGDAGFAVVTSAVAAVPFAIYSGTAQQHVTTFNFSNTNAVRAVTWPDLTGTVAFTSDVPAAATQANQETATSTTTYVSPGRQQFHPSAAKFWVVYTATPTLTTSYNVSSISNVGTGLVQVNFTTSFSSADYCIAGVSNTASSNSLVFVQARNTGSCQLQATLANTGAGQARAVTACGFGDQ